jgi:hypothetical protein
MAPRLETVTDHICGWPYFEPYVFTQKKPNKPRTKKVGTLAKKPRKPRKAKAA